MALRVLKLRNARNVRARDMGKAIGLTLEEVVKKEVDGTYTRAELRRIAKVLEAPQGWPDWIPPRLPRARIALSAPPPTPAERRRNEKTRRELRPAITLSLEAGKLLKKLDVSKPKTPEFRAQVDAIYDKFRNIRDIAQGILDREKSWEKAQKKRLKVKARKKSTAT